ncbi:MAG: PAS domain-containing protein [Oscillospiraceae bacterium]|nr:PAS domain-containing protein [Oscillospiraceae bacterium]
MKRRIFAVSFILAALAVAVTSVLITLAAYRNYFDVVKRGAAAELSYVGAGVSEFGAAYFDKLDTQDGRRLTWIARDGSVTGDTEADAPAMDNHLDRPEVKDALARGVGESTRYSDTLDAQAYYRAERLRDGSVLRIDITVQSVLQSFNEVILPIAFIALMVFLVAAFVAARLTRRIVLPLNGLKLDEPEECLVYDELAPLLERIKEQKRELDRRMKTLERRQAEVSAITENMNEGLLILDSGGTILSYNKSALRLLGASQANPMGRHYMAVYRGEGLRRIVQEALRGNEEPGAAQEEAAKEIPKEMPKEVPKEKPQEAVLSINQYSVQVLASPVREGRAIRGLLLVLLDVTEKQERDRLRREFTANVSHELKTPLTAISGYAELLTNGMAKPEDAPTFARNIHKDARRMVALINDLLFLSRLDETESSSEKSDVELLALCKRAARNLSASAADRDVTVTVSGEPATVTGISTVLEAMAANLIDNAVKYNKQGGSVAVEVHPTKSGAALTVSDTGIGIPKAEQSRVFERFYRVDKSRGGAIPGTGLGLAIVKHGAALHNASVELASGSAGTRVEILFNG